MFRGRSLLVALALVGLTAPFARAQSLEGAHQIELRIGAWNQLTGSRTELGAGVSTTADGSGFVGGLAYGHWLQENLALRITVGALAVRVNTDISTAGVFTETASVAELLLGMKWYVANLSNESPVRPFVGVGAGTFVGNQLEMRTGTLVNVVARTEAAMGGQLNGGADFVVSRHFLLSAMVGFNLMTDFSHAIGGSDNYSGPELTLGFSYLFGVR